MAPAQRRGKAGEVGIGGYPFAPILYGDSGMDRISDNLALKAPRKTKAAKKIPVTRARAN
jgi:hypothetical protein